MKDPVHILFSKINNLMYYYYYSYYYVIIAVVGVDNYYYYSYHYDIEYIHFFSFGISRKMWGHCIFFLWNEYSYLAKVH